MARSIRQQIMDAVGTRLRSILVTNGFVTNLGENVHEWRIAPFPINGAAGIVFRDTVCNTIQAEGHRQSLQIEVDIVARPGQTAADLRTMIADVYSAIGRDIFWGGLAMDTVPESDEIRIEQGEQRIGGASIKFSIVYRTREWDAYQRW